MIAKLKRLVPLFPFFGIILVSFFLASPIFTPWYNSDHAIHVLMIEKFNWSADWYYWGQDRLGSWIPLFGQIFNKLFQFNGIWSASVAQYLTLFFGFYFFQSFIRSYILKLVLCTAYFMPLALFNYQVFLAHPYASQLLFIGATFFLLKKLKGTKNQKSTMIISFSLGLSIVASVWVSDISVAIIPFYFIYFLLDRDKEISIKEFVSLRINKGDNSLWLGVLAILLSLIIGFILLFIAKDTAISDPRYETIFADKNEIKQAIVLFLNAIQESVVFNVNDLMVSFQTLIFCLVLVVGVFFTFKMKNRTRQFKNYTFLSLSFFLLMLVLASNWVMLFGYDLRYFTFVYVLFLFGLCYLWDSLETRIKKTGSLAMSLAVIFGAIHFIFSHTSDISHDKKEISYLALEAETKNLPPCTLIGTYWNGYNLASTRPHEIIAIPHEGHYTRNIWELEKAFQNENIYLISDDWLNEYPIEIYQRGYKLKKAGEPFKLRIYNYCKYEITDKP